MKKEKSRRKAKDLAVNFFVGRHGMRKVQFLTLAVLLLFANTVSFGGAKDDDEELLKVRRSVWIKWFENDQEALKKLVPEDTVVVSSGELGIKHQADVLKGAIDFH